MMNGAQGDDDHFEAQYKLNGKIVFTKSDCFEGRKRDTKYSQKRSQEMDDDEDEFVITL